MTACRLCSNVSDIFNESAACFGVVETRVKNKVAVLATNFLGSSAAGSSPTEIAQFMRSPAPIEQAASRIYLKSILPAIIRFSTV